MILILTNFFASLRQVPIRRWLTSATCLLILSSCSENNQKSFVQINLPDFSESQLHPKADFLSSPKPKSTDLTPHSPPCFRKDVGAFSSQTWSSDLEPKDIREINCFLVAVGGPEEKMQTSLCSASDFSRDIKFGPWIGAVPGGQTLSIEVPSGPNREFYVVGFKAVREDACSDFRSGKIDKTSLSYPRIIASTKTHIKPGNNDLELTVSLKNSVELDNCHLSGTGLEIPPMPRCPATHGPSIRVAGHVTGQLAGGKVNSIISDGDIAYLGGQFRSVNGQDRANLAAINIKTGEVLPLNTKFSGPVHTLAIHNQKLYVGGQFRYANFDRLTSAALFKQTNTTGQNGSGAELESGFPTFEGGRVRTIISDGNNGWFVGGEFTSVNGQPRKGLAHVRSDFSLSDLRFDILPQQTTVNQATGGVRALALDGNTLYVGGEFGKVGAESRNNFAAIDLSTNKVSAWNPDVKGSVNAVAFSSDLIFLGGAFTEVANNANQKYLVVFEKSSLQPLTLAKRPNNSVLALAVDSDRLFVGGQFDQVLGSTATDSVQRNRVAAFRIETASSSNRASDGPLTLDANWSPSVNGPVYALRVSPNQVFIGGSFTVVGGASRNNLASIQKQTGKLDTAWNPNPSAAVFGMELLGNDLYLAGAFTQIGPLGSAIDRKHFAVVSTQQEGRAGSLVINLMNPALAIAVRPSGTAGSPALIALGGDFETIGGVERLNLASIELSTADPQATGQLTAWAPKVNGPSGLAGIVKKILVNGNDLLVGGFFQGIDSFATPKNLAAFDLSASASNSTPALKSWSPNPDDAVLDLALQGDSLFVAGDFKTIGTMTRPRLAALDKQNYTIQSLNLESRLPNGKILTIHPVEQLLYLGGEFTQIGNANRFYLAAIDLNKSNGGTNGATGELTEWAPDPNAPVETLASVGDTLYVGGNFTRLAGQSRSRIAALDLRGPYPKMWNPGANSAVSEIHAAGSTVLIGGSFQAFGGSTFRSGFSIVSSCPNSQ